MKHKALQTAPECLWGLRAEPSRLAWLSQPCVAETNLVARKFRDQGDKLSIRARAIWLELQLVSRHSPKAAGDKVPADGHLGFWKTAIWVMLDANSSPSPALGYDSYSDCAVVASYTLATTTSPTAKLFPAPPPQTPKLTCPSRPQKSMRWSVCKAKHKSLG